MCAAAHTASGGSFVLRWSARTLKAPETYALMLPVAVLAFMKCSRYEAIGSETCGAYCTAAPCLSGAHRGYCEDRSSAERSALVAPVASRCPWNQE